jgi:5-methylcytosine-specific restriction endonuclease McrA
MANRVELIQRARLRKDRTANANRLRLWQYLSEHPCVDCGEDDIVVLEFDHLRDKRANVSQMVSWGLAWSAIEAEIAKCEVRCVNCHVRKTARDVGIYELKHSHRQLSEAVLLYSVA